MAVVIKAGHERDNEHARIQGGKHFLTFELEKAEIGNNHGQPHRNQGREVDAERGQHNQHCQRQQAVHPPERASSIHVKAQNDGEKERGE